MYQALYYDRFEKTYYLRDDNEGWNIFQYTPTYYKYDSNGSLKTLFGDRCSIYKGKLDYENPDILEKDIDKELVLLRDLYYETDDIPNHHNIVYLDIEIQILGALTSETIREANAEITSIALIDGKTSTRYCLIVDPEEQLEYIDKDKKIIIPCKNEKSLIKKFLKLWKELDPTICVHYNGDFFDIPYLYYRIRKVLPDFVHYLSPIGKIDENISRTECPIKIGGINCLDFLSLYKKYVPKEEPSYKLDFIGKKHVGLGKIEYSGNLNTLFKNDPDTFIEYNIRDVVIIEELEKKLKYIALTVLISHLCHVPYETIYFNSVLNEGAILTYLKRKGIISPNKPTNTNPELKQLFVGDIVNEVVRCPVIEGEIISINKKTATIRTLSNKIVERDLNTIKRKDPFAGGYLLDPVPGLYYDLIDLDFTSLYPSIIKSLNLGIETLIGRIKPKDNFDNTLTLDNLKLKDPEEEVVIEKLDTKTYKLKKGKIKLKDIISLIEENNWSIAASGAIFRNDKKSIVCEVLEDWFDKREYYRGLKKDAGKKSDWDNYNLYDSYQLAFKILQNAVFGTFAVAAWRYTDGHKILPGAITNSGQRLTQESIDYVNNLINKKLGTEGETFIRASDTDSLYIQVTKLLEQKLGNKTISKEEKINELLVIAEDIQTLANDNLKHISKGFFNINKQHYFQLKQEVIVERAYWAGKRRYAMYIVNKEGVSLEELEMKGLDLMKSNMTPLFKEFGKELITEILYGKQKQDIDSKIINFKEYLNTIDYEKIAKPTGVKKVRQYIEYPSGPGKMFSTLLKGTPINTRAAIYYNDLLKYYKQNVKYMEFTEGDKMYYIPLKPNEYKIDVIGFRGGNEDPEEIKEFITKYADITGGWDTVLLEKLKKIYKDLNWNFPTTNKYANEFFVF